jgi:uncharacterized protein (DUF885 family)
MAIDQLADELMDVFFDALPVDASLLGVRDREDWLTDDTDDTEAAGTARSARLVVDTGLHAQGWSRQQAVDFMVGRVEIQRIRAAVAPGEAFDVKAFGVKAFHDVVLGTGPLPMEVLDEVVQAWAGGQR